MFLIESNIKLLLEQIIATFALYNFIDQYKARYFIPIKETWVTAYHPQLRIIF